MRYCINGFNQKKLLENGLDNDDSLILNWLISFYAHAECYQSDTKYRWISIKKCLEDLPVLQISSTRTIQRKFQKYEELGLVGRVFDNGTNKTRSYLKIEQKLIDMMYERGVTPVSHIPPVTHDTSVTLPMTPVSHDSILDDSLLVKKDISKDISKKIDFSLIQNWWNDLSDEFGLAKIKKITAQRQISLRARIKDAGGEQEFMDTVYQAIKGSNFLRGKNNRGWKADFTFILQEKSYTRMSEGGYQDQNTGIDYSKYETPLF